MNKTSALKIIALCLICSFFTGVWVYAATPSIIQTVGLGPYPGADRYTIFLISGTYYARDQNGVNEFSSSNFSQVVNNAFAAGDGTVKLTANTYVADSTLTPDEGDRLIGEGKSATWIASVADPIISWTGQDHIEIEDLTLDGDGMANDAINIYGTWDSVTNSFIILKDLVITDVDTGIWLNSTLWSTFDNIRISESVNGVYFNDGCVNNEINKLQVTDCSGDGIVIDYVSQRSEGLSFTDTVIFNVTSQSVLIDDGFEIYFQNSIFDYGRAADFVNIRGGNTIKFDNCYFSTFPVAIGGVGTVLVSPTQTDVNSTQFNRCTFAWLGGWGLSLIDSGGTPVLYATVTDCVFLNNGDSGAGGDLYIEDSDYIKVIGCDFQSNEQYAVYENAASLNNTIAFCNSLYTDIVLLGSGVHYYGVWNASIWASLG